MSGGLLGGLSDPKIMAQISERQRVVDRVAAQMGVSVQVARQALADFETDLSHEGHELN
jgi:hypothetical protein